MKEQTVTIGPPLHLYRHPSPYGGGTRDEYWFAPKTSVVPLAFWTDLVRMREAAALIVHRPKPAYGPITETAEQGILRRQSQPRHDARAEAEAGIVHALMTMGPSDPKEPDLTISALRVYGRRARLWRGVLAITAWVLNQTAGRVLLHRFKKKCEADLPPEAVKILKSGGGPLRWKWKHFHKKPAAIDHSSVRPDDIVVKNCKIVP
jgi:hypothetical protein